MKNFLLQYNFNITILVSFPTYIINAYAFPLAKTVLAHMVFSNVNDSIFLFPSSLFILLFKFEFLIFRIY